ncbi:hypothetical protein B7C51_11425 [Paenibacillus larvae subsp. pulvifaciens]|uniref:Uncharacterized protein n=1 Tax=Paenibacillus larvae subsp. pulvifaciens TaxID=1477 RepID=A0A1V0UTG6_9BACL|nr:hypothetical protein [Paenibacillus larvae]ARF68290.1 hypothetical protein B7C51_11425 [Paenibacillus larvae subsp. pulvifaciens]
MNRLIPQLYTILLYTWKTILNKILIRLQQTSFLSNKGTISAKKTASFLKMAKVGTLIAYILWIALMVLFQIFFHYISFSPDETELLLVFGFILSAFFITGYPIHQDFSLYIYESNQPIPVKKRLLLLNTFLGVTVSWSFIFLLSLPFLFCQYYWYGFSGISVLLTLLLILLVIGFVTDFFKFIGLYRKIYSRGQSNRFIAYAGHLIFLISIPFLSQFFKTMIDQFILKLNPEDRINVIQQLLGYIPFRLTEASFSYVYLMAAAGITLGMIISTKWVCKSFFKEKILHIPNRRLFFPSHPYGALITHFVRKNGWMNNEIIAAVFMTFFIKQYTDQLDASSLFTIAVPVSILLSACVFFNKADYIFMLKQNQWTRAQISCSYALYIFIQYIFVQILLGVLGTYSLSLTGFWSWTESILFGFVFISCTMSCYISTLYTFDGMIEPKFFYTVSTYLINGFLLLCTTPIYVLEKIMNPVLLLFLTKLAVPYIVIFVYYRVIRIIRGPIHYGVD